MKSLNLALTFFIILSFSFVTNAESIKLGEYAGNLDGIVVYRVPNRPIDQRSITCKTGLNIYLNESDLEIPFSFYGCSDASFNGEALSFKTLNQLVYLDGLEVGSVAADGTINIQVNIKSIQNLEVQASQPFCGFKFGTTKVPYEINKILKLTLKKLDEKSYSFTRELTSEKIYFVIGSLDPKDCPAVHKALSRENIVGSMTRSISGILSK